MNCNHHLGKKRRYLDLPKIVLGAQLYLSIHRHVNSHPAMIYFHEFLKQEFHELTCLCTDKSNKCELTCLCMDRLKGAG